MKVIFTINFEIVLVLGFTPLVTGLRCYHCIYEEGNPESDTSCKDNPDESLLKACAEDRPSCVTTFGEEDGKHIIARSCSQIPTDFHVKLSEQKCYTPAAEFAKVYQGGCFCDDKDGCNTGTGFKSSVDGIGVTWIIFVVTIVISLASRF